jgi:invasion protein IalB
MRSHSIAMFAAVTGLMLAPALAQTPPSPGQAPSGAAPAAAQNQPTKVEQHGDWVLTCRKADAQAPQNCELVQTITVNGQKAPFAELAIGKPKTDMPMQVTAVVPNNVSFPSSVKILLDEKDKSPFDLAWARCLPPGCFANAVLKDDVQKKWGALETQGRVIFKAGNTQEIVMPISFKGLKSALEALAKEK